MSGDFVETSRPVLDWVLRTTWEASLIAALVLLAQWLLRGRVSARWRYNLWLLVVARLLLPAVPGTHFSPFNFVELPQPPTLRPPAPRLNAAPPARAVPVPGPATEPRQEVYLASDVQVMPLPEVHAGSPAPLATVSFSDPLQTASAFATPAEAGAEVPQWPPAGRLPDARPAHRQHRVQHAAPSTHRRAPVARRQGSVPAPTGAVPWHRRFNWTALAAMVWLTGAAFVAARLAWVTLRLSAAVRELRPVHDPALSQLLAECAAPLRLRRAPRVLEGPDGFGPALVGLLRPRVVLPGCVLRGSFHRDELRLILMHELAHLKRWDVAANWLLAVLGALHWFNPVLWFAFRRMRLDREMACDELVLSATAPGVARAYGPTLLKLLQTLSRGSALPGMVGVLEGKPSIRRRIAMIARFDRSNRNSSPLYGIALSALAGGVALTGAVRGQHAPPPPPAPQTEVRELAVELTREGESVEPAPELPATPPEPEALPAPEPETAPAAAPAPSPQVESGPAARVTLPPATPAPATRPATRAARPAATAVVPAAATEPAPAALIAAVDPAARSSTPAPAAGAAAGRQGGFEGGARVVGGAAAPAARAPGGRHSGYGGYGAYPGGYGGYGPQRQRGHDVAGGAAGQPQPAVPAYGRRPGLPGGYPAMGPGMAPGGQPASARVDDPAARNAHARATDALRATLPVNFDNVPLDDALRVIGDAVHLDVIADWKALESIGVSQSSPVALRLKQGAPAEQVLTWVLRSVGGDDLGYTVDHGVVVVAPQDRIERMVVTRAYKLGGLADSGQALESLVRDTVAPQSWRENGRAGLVRFFNNQLFVTATEPNHRQVERLLGLMEAQGVRAPQGAMMPGTNPGMGGGMPGARPGTVRSGTVRSGTVR